MAHDNTSFRQQIFNIAVAKIKAMVEPDGVGNDIGRKSMSFVGIHPAILPNPDS